MIHISYVSWDSSDSAHVFGCIGLFILAIMIGCLSGGLVASLLEYRIDYKVNSLKYLVVLLLCNLLSPILMYLLIKYPVEYYE